MAYWNFVAVFLALQVVIFTRIDAVRITTSGERCVFPFTYEGETYNNCLTKNHDRPWCSTTAKYVGKWGNCEGFTASGVYTVAGDSCTIPFTYEGKVYHSCTTAYHLLGLPWCSITANYDIDKKWGDCRDFEPSDLWATGPPALQFACVFPFIYNGQKYKSCITNGNRQPWCSATANYDKDLERGNCLAFHSTNKFKTTEGQRCAFPFVYRGQLFNQCTMKNHDRFWCSTTTNYDEDKKWGNCIGY